MQEQQGNLMPQLSGLPGPRPFNKGKNKMENENTSSNPMQADGKPDMGKPVTDSVDEIVAKAAAALGAGKAFGGWTDKVEEGIVAGAPTTNYRGSPSSPTRASTQHAMTRDRQLNQAKKNRTASGKAGGEGMKNHLLKGEHRQYDEEVSTTLVPPAGQTRKWERIGESVATPLLPRT